MHAFDQCLVPVPNLDLILWIFKVRSLLIVLGLDPSNCPQHYGSFPYLLSSKVCNLWARKFVITHFDASCGHDMFNISGFTQSSISGLRNLIVKIC